MANIMRIGGGASGKPRKLLSSLANGSIVSVLEDGILTQFCISHNYEPDLNGAGRTLFVRKENHSDRPWHSSNVNAYATSDIDAWLNGDYKNMLSPTVKANMGVTTFKYTPGNGNKTVTNLAKSVFLLSVTELNKTANYANIEGSALPIAGALQIAQSNGVAANQWTRTPGTYDNTYSYFVAANGNVEGDSCTKSLGIRPCFTLPSDMALRAEPLPDGSWALADEEFLLDTETAKTTPKSAVVYTNGIADLDAATLHEIGKAISSNPKITNETSVVYYDSGDVHRKISVGDQITITMDSATVYDIIGFNHDDLSLGTAYEQPTATGKAGFTLQMHDCRSSTVGMHSSDTNATGWSGCNFRTTYVPQYIAMFTEAFSGVLKSVRKLTKGSTTEDIGFLLSEVEVFGNNPYSTAGEGNQYAYYKAGNSKVKAKNGTAANWWERSPVPTVSTSYCYITTAGAGAYNKASGSLAVALAICI